MDNKENTRKIRGAMEEKCARTGIDGDLNFVRGRVSERRSNFAT